MKKRIKSVSDLVGDIRPFWKDGWRIKRLCKKKEKKFYDITKVHIISPNNAVFGWEDVLSPGYSEFDREEASSAYDLFNTINGYFKHKLRA